MKQKIILIIILLLEITALLQWSHCNTLNWHFSSFDLQLRLIADIHGSQATPVWQTRFFDNKVIGTIIDTLNIYGQYFNFTFLITLLSIVGTAGLFMGLFSWISTKKKHLWTWIFFVYLIAMPLLEVFNLLKFNASIQIILFAIPYIFWSLFGFYNYTKTLTRTRFIFLLILILLSIWYITVATQPFMRFCE